MFNISVFTLLFCFVFAFETLTAGADSTLTASSEFIYHDQSVIANAASSNITVEEFIYSYEYGPAFIKKSKNSKSSHLNYMINEKLLAEFGYQNGFDTLRQTREMLKAIHNDLMTEEMFIEDIERNIDISEEELDTVINRKNITVELQWLYSENDGEHNKIMISLNEGVPFDTLYKRQLANNINPDDRYLKISLYQLGMNNKMLARIVDTLTIGNYSKPVNAGDGWYMVKLLSAYKNPILNEEDYNRLRSESISAVKKEKMDAVSDKYVQKMFSESKPEINNETFEILKSYIGRYYLSQEEYQKWGLAESLNRAMEAADASESTINELALVELSDTTINLNNFLEWFWIRSQYMKFDKTNLYSYSSSLRQIVLLMVRDELLTEEARLRGFDGRNNVLKQLSWWKDKIVYSSLRNELSNLIMLENEEINSAGDSQSDDSKIEILNIELSKRIFHLLTEIKNRSIVNINNELLQQIKVSTANDPKAIDLYTVKKGGLIPRTPYPTIDYDWLNWE